MRFADIARTQLDALGEDVYEDTAVVTDLIVIAKVCEVNDGTSVTYLHSGADFIARRGLLAVVTDLERRPGYSCAEEDDE